MNLTEIVRGRRSIRKYQDREIPQDVLNEILEDALWAPSGTNRQNWHIYVVRGEKKENLFKSMIQASQVLKRRLDQLLPEKAVKATMNFFKSLGGAPVLLMIYMPKYTYDINKDMSLSERYSVEYDRFTNALSASALIQNILLLAKEKGLGTCWLTGPKYAEDAINEEMGITDKEMVSVVTIGYPSEEPRAPRRKGEKIEWIGY
ncbi:MAG: nitroreductase family protein [Peptococcaceae bacterium]|nr:nitroreductase family protein [Peptococcaceae bacterium]